METQRISESCLCLTSLEESVSDSDYRLKLQSSRQKIGQKQSIGPREDRKPELNHKHGHLISIKEAE